MTSSHLGCLVYRILAVHQEIVIGSGTTQATDSAYVETASSLKPVDSNSDLHPLGDLGRLVLRVSNWTRLSRDCSRERSTATLAGSAAFQGDRRDAATTRPAAFS